MHSRPRSTKHFESDLGNSTQGDIIPTPQAVQPMDPVSREAVCHASYRPMTIILGETIVEGKQVLPPDDIARYGKRKGRDGDQTKPNRHFDEPLSPFERHISPLETVNNPYLDTAMLSDGNRPTLHDELSQLSLDGARFSLDSSTRTSFDEPPYEDENDDDDLDITAELQENKGTELQENKGDVPGECRCRVNSYEEVLTRWHELTKEATAAKANTTPNIAGPSRAHIPREREAKGASPIKPVPRLKYQGVDMGNLAMTPDISPWL